MASETLNRIAIQSEKRQEQVSFFNVCLLGKLNNFLREIVGNRSSSLNLSLILSYICLKESNFFLFYICGDG